MAVVGMAVVGAGFMGGRWARAFSEHHGARLRVVSDVRPDIGREIALRYGADYMSDPIAAVERDDVQGVVVCTPNLFMSTFPWQPSPRAKSLLSRNR